MIAALLRYAREQGLDAGPYWVSVKAKVIDLETGAIEEAFMPCHKRQRSGTKAYEKPTLFIEKGKNINLLPETEDQGSKEAVRRKLFRSTFVQAHRAFGHPLAVELVRFLENGGTVPEAEKAEDDGYVTFRWRGLDLLSDKRLQNLANQTIDREDQDYLPHPGICTQCGQQDRLVDLHRNGLAELHPMASILVSYARKAWAGKKEGENLPMCLTCMRLYTNAINVLLREHGQSLNAHTLAALGVAAKKTDRHSIFPLGADGVILGASNSCAFVLDIRQGLGDELRQGLPIQTLLLRRRNIPLMIEVATSEDRHMVEEQPAPPLACVGTQCGELFAYLEGVLAQKQRRAPDLQTALRNPRLVFLQIIPQARMAAMQDDGTVPGWFRKLLQAAIGTMVQFPTTLTEDEKANFLVAYCKANTKRQGFGKVFGVTPWQLRLADALVARGLAVDVEYNVWHGKEEEPPQRPANGQIVKDWYRIDIALVDVRLAIEVDGRQRGPHQRNFEEDALKALDLTLAGWRVIRVTNRNLNTDENIATWADGVARLYQQLKK